MKKLPIMFREPHSFFRDPVLTYLTRNSNFQSWQTGLDSRRKLFRNQGRRRLVRNRAGPDEIRIKQTQGLVFSSRTLCCARLLLWLSGRGFDSLRSCSQLRSRSCSRLFVENSLPCIKIPVWCVIFADDGRIKSIGAYFAAFVSEFSSRYRSNAQSLL